MKKNMLAISAITAALLVGCTTTQPNTAKVLKEQTHTIKFSGVDVPVTDLEKRSIQASNYIEVDGVKTKIGFHTIARSGDTIGDNVFGLIYDHNGNPIYEADGSVKISNSNDFSSLLPVGDKLFMVSHFETRPAAMYLTELEQSSNGQLKAVKTKNIDFSKFNGLWVPCAGSVTPWNTHLGSEEYEPDAASVKANGSINSYYDAMADYFEGDLKALNPYDYGWSTEVNVLNENGDLKVDKHYSMGRFAHELAYVMPDEKTVYLSDDGTNVSLFMFVADEKGDLSSGTLYASKWKQKDSKHSDISWVNLGHSNNTEIKQALDKKITFNDIFDKTYLEEDGTCDVASFTSINTTHGAECLKVKPGMEEIASRLESRRYAAIKGATTEFRKMEGITFSPKAKSLFVSISSIGKGMENHKKKGKLNNKYDIAGNNDIKLQYNPCGAVYNLDINPSANIKATDGSIIDSKYAINTMNSLVAGTPDKSIKGNKCSVNGLANPDNITFIPNTNTLIIGEDTGSGHQNDYVWSYNTKDDQLTRIETTPYGSETTGVYYYNNIGEHGYLMSVVQHPYGEGDALTKEKDMPKQANKVEDMRAYTGYVGPLPVISK